jgi:formate/nitrite transporter
VTTFEKKLSLPRMTYYWTLVWLFNFAGSSLIAWLYYRSGLPLKYDESILKLFVSLGVSKTHLTFEQAFIRGIFCNVFVCMGVWAATAAKDTAGKVLSIAVIITAFVACGYEHCVANMFIISEALMAKAHYLIQAGGDLQAMSALVNNIPVEKINHLGVKSFLIDNLVPVTLGNIVGGLFFVGLTGFISHKKDME